MHRIEIEQIADHDLGTHVAQRLRACLHFAPSHAPLCLAWPLGRRPSDHGLLSL
jgi:hypothetical protein